jgi:hypothetical protein
MFVACSLALISVAYFLTERDNDPKAPLWTALWMSWSIGLFAIYWYTGRRWDRSTTVKKVVLFSVSFALVPFYVIPALQVALLVIIVVGICGFGLSAASGGSILSGWSSNGKKGSESTNNQWERILGAEAIGGERVIRDGGFTYILGMRVHSDGGATYVGEERVITDGGVLRIGDRIVTQAGESLFLDGKRVHE